MKTKFLKTVVIFLISMTAQNNLVGQVTHVPNSGGSSTDYVGWDVNQPFALTIKHERANQPINFFTNQTIGGVDIQRMKIFEDQVTATNGINNLNVGRVGIFESSLRWDLYPTPVSLLHLGHGWQKGNGGHRSWMDIGTYTVADSDHMYFGLKHEPQRSNIPYNYSPYMDAVIGWGDNENISENFNDLRFIFTAINSTPNDPLGTSEDGRETMRISYNGNVGIGNFYIPGSPLPSFIASSAIRPARKLEILDEGRNQPQFRLTFTQQGKPNPAYTDFQATSTGDLIINPKNNAINGFVGINTNTPTTTLHLFANNPNESGLRLERLTSTSPTVASNGRVLTVDGFGNVVLTNDNGGGGGSPNTANNGLTLTGSNIQLGGPLVQNTQVALDNYAFKFTGPIFAGQTLRWQIENDGRQKSWCSDLA